MFKTKRAYMKHNSLCGVLVGLICLPLAGFAPEALPDATTRRAMLLNDMAPEQIARRQALPREYSARVVMNDGAPTNQAATATPLKEIQTLIDRGDYRQAIEAANGLIAKSPRDSEAYRLRAQARRGLDDLAGSLKDANKAVELDP